MSEYSLLLVDDNEELLESFTTWFSRRGFHMTTAAHPRLALAAAAYNTFDAVIVDVTLPEMNGLDLIDRLKNFGDFPIVVLSGDDNPMLLDAAVKRGVYRLLVKPVSMRVVEEVIRKSLEDSSPSSSRQTVSTEQEPSC